MRPTPEGVGVKGGGLAGDSDAAALRFLGKGVAGRSGIAKSDSCDGGLGSSCGAVTEALPLRFLGAAAGFSTLVYFATPFVALVAKGTEALLLATRAERLRDIFKWVSILRRMVV